ncbi:hypothetical protein [Ranid herpesvirus 3]|uniref:Uncharacterized protein n=1 Tax=Ranid herpesvirus 3 TaxID=1987509 RepID=A0A1X9T5D7_9VIRU|nr:hypothetical protein [Ranid herpesvirus 3]ARR28918.1 hypothetical protein [Ranid herpesvirus 3]
MSVQAETSQEGGDPRHNVSAHWETKKSLNTLMRGFSSCNELERSAMITRLSIALPVDYYPPKPSKEDDQQDRLLQAAHRYRTVACFNWLPLVLQSCSDKIIWTNHLVVFYSGLKVLYTDDPYTLHVLCWRLWMRPLIVPCVQSYNVICLIRTGLGLPPLLAHKTTLKRKACSFVPYTALVTEKIEKKCSDMVSLEVVVSEADQSRLTQWETRANRWIWVAAMQNSGQITEYLPGLSWVNERIIL